MKRLLPAFFAILFTAAFAIGFTAPSAYAGPKPVSFGLGVSTLGLTVTGAYHPASRHLYPSLMLGAMSYSGSTTDSGTSYSGSFKNHAVGLLANLDPGKPGGFVISGGAIYTDYAFTGRADNLTIGSTTSSLDVSVAQKRKISPIVMVGFETGGAKARVHFDAKLGAIFTTGFSVSGSDPNGKFSQAQIDSQLTSGRDSAAKLKVLPFAEAGVTFAF